MTVGGPIVESYGHYHTEFPQFQRVGGTWYPSSNPHFHAPKRPPDPHHWYRQEAHVKYPSSDSNSTMSSLNPEEMENFQRLSDQYQPEVQGPLVGDKMPMAVLMREYAQADPTYVAKTVSLSATHSAYRPIKGDGQCGWRAAVFGYFETLLLLGDLEVVQREIAQIRSFDDIMRMAGIELELLADMFDSTWELFAKVLKAVERGDKNENIILDTFNDEGESNYILYHFKTMTSAFMHLHADRYQEFLEMPLQEYRATRIDPSNQEIDQIGLQGLTDGVIGPAGIALEVSYLDRSVGDVVTPHAFVPNATNWPTIRLLYRPGHYDMVYKASREMQVSLQHREPHYEALHSAEYANPNMDMELYESIFPNETVWQAPTVPRMYETNPSQMSYGSEPNYNPPYLHRYSQPDHYPSYPTSNQMAQPSQFSSTWSSTGSSEHVPVALRPLAPTSSSSSLDRTQPNPEPNIRFTLSQYSYSGRGRQTAPIDRSPTGQPHFNHQNFQPEQYEYEHDGGGGVDGGGGGKKSKPKSERNQK